MTGAVTNTEYVFTTEDGHAYPESTVRRYFALAKKLAGITRRCRVGDLRHTFASNLASEGLSLLDIRDALGHTTARMSERYAKPNERSLERMRDALNARNGGRKNEAVLPKCPRCRAVIRYGEIGKV
jgi:integrase